ncbi:hypothetical protein [Bosea sp. (in: a-proteobacteria)]|uniref:hypothetical protein n=1 Tax=Bosea sp. (in: a-proteobacteria) TaxID=1871050 RepID=UPI003B3BA425
MRSRFSGAVVEALFGRGSFRAAAFRMRLRGRKNKGAPPAHRRATKVAGRGKIKRPRLSAHPAKTRSSRHERHGASDASAASRADAMMSRRSWTPSADRHVCTAQWTSAFGPPLPTFVARYGLRKIIGAGEKAHIGKILAIASTKLKRCARYREPSLSGASLVFISLGIIWLGCAAIFLELAERAPLIED